MLAGDMPEGDRSEVMPEPVHPTRLPASHAAVMHKFDKGLNLRLVEFMAGTRVLRVDLLTIFALPCLPVRIVALMRRFLTVVNICGIPGKFLFTFLVCGINLWVVSLKAIPSGLVRLCTAILHVSSLLTFSKFPRTDAVVRAVATWLVCGFMLQGALPQ